MSLAAHSGACLNCERLLTGQFCSHCGQKARPADPSLADFIHEFSHEMLHVDGKIFRSVGALLVRPGRLTKDYCRGRRAHWISPIRLYLVFSLAYFAYISLDDSPEDASHTGSRLMFVLVPLFAWLTSLVAAARRNFPQHLIFALHLHAVLFAAWLAREVLGSALSPRFMPSTRWLGTLMFVYVSVYAILAFQYAYEENWWKSTLKMTGIIVVYAAIVFVAVMTLAIAASM